MGPEIAPSPPHGIQQVGNIKYTAEGICAGENQVILTTIVHIDRVLGHYFRIYFNVTNFS